MIQRRRVMLLIVIMVIVAIAATWIAMGMLYHAAFVETRHRLAELVDSQAQLLQAIYRYEFKVGTARGLSQNQVLSRVLEQFQDAHTHFPGMGRTGEFTLAKKRGENIVFLLSHRHATSEDRMTIPFASQAAEPMRRALSGQSGTVVGLDYRDVTVAAAYQPMEDLGLALVAKIDLAEIRQPFVRAAVLSLLIAVGLTACGAFLFRRVGDPLIHAIEESEFKYRSLFEAAAVGVVLAEGAANPKVTQVNPAFGRFIGYDRKELTNEDLGRFVIEDDRPLLLEAFDDIHAGRSSKVELDQRFVRRDGSTVWGHISVSLMQIRPARPVLWICMVLDIDRQKQADEELHRLMEQLQRSNRELEQFAYVASHDLQEPLRMVASYTQLLARRYQDRLDQDANDFIHFAVDGATRMQKLINDLLAYSRVTRHGKPLEPTNAHAALEEAIANLATAIQATGTIITRGDLPLVMADHSQLVRVFQNLIGNAVKFTDRGPSKIHVSAERRGDECVFAVKDNGIGIEPQYHERIFVLFQHLNPRDQYEGTGLGLSICKRIIERHGGTIWVESNTDVGTTSSFTLKSYRETTPT